MPKQTHGTKKHSTSATSNKHNSAPSSHQQHNCRRSTNKSHTPWAFRQNYHASSDQQTANSPTLAAARYYPLKSPPPWAQAAHYAKWSIHISSAQTNEHFAAPLHKNNRSSAAQQPTAASPSNG